MKLSFSIFILLFALQSHAESKVLATVNGTEITQAEVEHFMQHVKRPLSHTDALSELINIEALVSHRLQNPIEKNSALGLELERNRKGLIAANLLETFISSFNMSDKELNAAYKEQYLSASNRQEFNANHILVKTEQEAVNLIQSLNNKGDFETLAKKHSTGPSGKKGGALGWFGSKRMVKAFSEATALLKKGKYTLTPVKTQFGWHIIKLNDIRDKPAPSLKSVEDKIKRRYSAIKLSAEIKKIQEASKIIIKAVK